MVAVIDTGYLAHSDLIANILPGYDFIDDPFISQDGDGRDSDALDPGDWETADQCYAGSPASDSSWHGTHVAGSIAAKTDNGTGVAGVAFDARILPVRVLGRCGGYMSDIADGMIWAAGGTVSGVPANANPAQVLNLSLGGGGSCSSTTQAAINSARASARQWSLRPAMRIPMRPTLLRLTAQVSSRWQPPIVPVPEPTIRTMVLWWTWQHRVEAAAEVFCRP